MSNDNNASTPKAGISTQSVRGGEDKFKASDALTTPVYQTAT